MDYSSYRERVNFPHLQFKTEEMQTLNMKKKICFLAEGFPSKGRPSFVFVQQLVFALVDLGYDISVIAPQSLTHALVRREKVLPKKTIEKTQNGNPFQVYRPYNISFGNHFSSLSKYLENSRIKVLNNLLDEIKPDVLYGHFWHVANRMTDYALSHGLPLFVACGEGDNALENLVAELSHEKKKNLVKAVNGVISVSTENKRKCIEFGLAKESRIVVLPNCVDDSLVHPTDGSQIREKLKLSKEDFLIAFVGGFIERKGPNRVLSAIRKIEDDHIKVMFIGKYIGGEVFDLNGKEVVFKGSLDHENLPLYLGASDAFVLPTLKEGCCNAIVEALACGVPVISSNRPFNDDILNEGNSIQVDPEDVDAISKAIYTLKSDRELYKCKKEYAVEHSNEYSITERARKISEFIERNI